MVRRPRTQRHQKKYYAFRSLFMNRSLKYFRVSDRYLHSHVHLNDRKLHSHLHISNHNHQFHLKSRETDVIQSLPNLVDAECCFWHRRQFVLGILTSCRGVKAFCQNPCHGMISPHCRLSWLRIGVLDQDMRKISNSRNLRSPSTWLINPISMIEFTLFSFLFRLDLKREIPIREFARFEFLKSGLF